ncbi:protein FAM133-like [Lineus longissimus]|uniref:protein FAM133-like n=1 Tax=Lineus longissimus TaxID=88925 RepID=UPI00315D950B
MAPDKMHSAFSVNIMNNEEVVCPHNANLLKAKKNRKDQQKPATCITNSREAVVVHALETIGLKSKEKRKEKAMKKVKSKATWKKKPAEKVKSPMEGGGNWSKKVEKKKEKEKENEKKKKKKKDGGKLGRKKKKAETDK